MFRPREVWTELLLEDWLRPSQPWCSRQPLPWEEEEEEVAGPTWSWGATSVSEWRMDEWWRSRPAPPLAVQEEREVMELQDPLEQLEVVELVVEEPHPVRAAAPDPRQVSGTLRPPCWRR